MLSQTIIVGDNEDVITNHMIGGRMFKFVLRFTSDSSGKGSVHWAIDGDTIRFTISNWHNAVGTILPQPVRLGEVGDGREFGFQIAHWAIGRTGNRADFQIMVGGNYAEPDEP